MMTEAKKVALAAVMSYEFIDLERFVKTVAQEHTIANLGQDIFDRISPEMALRQPQGAVGAAFQQLREDCESDELCDGVDEEYRGWLKTARKDVAELVKRGATLTLENARLAFEKKGPFAPKKKG